VKSCSRTCGGQNQPIKVWKDKLLGHKLKNTYLVIRLTPAPHKTGVLLSGFHTDFFIANNINDIQEEIYDSDLSHEFSLFLYGKLMGLLVCCRGGITFKSPEKKNLPENLSNHKNFVFFSDVSPHSK
jgi:hypothetical protein